MPLKISKTISKYIFCKGAVSSLMEELRNTHANKFTLCVLDAYFRNHKIHEILSHSKNLDVCIYDSQDEPKTEDIDRIIENYKEKKLPSLIVGIGGGATLDVAKAVSNLFTNPGIAADYQGWDLVKKPGIYKIGVPTISGTGAEASRTCVLLNKKKNLKMGMNSEYTYFDSLVLDPELTATVPREQYFFTGMDTYIHCIESLQGSHRHPIADAYSREALNLCCEVFLSKDMMSLENRTKLMTASFLGGSAIANSYVGVVHPLSAALSVVFDSHHCVSNCMVMQYMQEFYPQETSKFLEMAKKQEIAIPKLLSKDARSLDNTIYEKLYQASIVHEKPLQNALGKDYKKVFSKEKVKELFLDILY